MPKVDVWTIKDGEAVAFYEYFDTAGMLKAMIRVKRRHWNTKRFGALLLYD